MGEMFITHAHTLENIYDTKFAIFSYYIWEKCLFYMLTLEEMFIIQMFPYSHTWSGDVYITCTYLTKYSSIVVSKFSYFEGTF